MSKNIEIKGRFAKRVFATLTAALLTVGMIMAGFIVNPITAEAVDNPKMTMSAYESSCFNIYGTLRVDMSASMQVKNHNTWENGKTSYIPTFEALLVAEKLESGIPSGYESTYPTKEGSSGNDIAGYITLTGNTTAQFGKTKALIIGSGENPADGRYDSGCYMMVPQDGLTVNGQPANGKFRYQIKIYEIDSADKALNEMFNLPTQLNGSTGSNRRFLDVIIENGAVTQTIIRDGDENKVHGLDEDYQDELMEKDESQLTEEVISQKYVNKIVYNTANLIMSNTVFTDGDSNLTPFKYDLNVIRTSPMGVQPYISTTYLTWTDNTKDAGAQTTNFGAVTDAGGFDSHIFENVPYGATVNCLQTQQKQVTGPGTTYANWNSKNDLALFTTLTWYDDNIAPVTAKATEFNSAYQSTQGKYGTVIPALAPYHRYEDDEDETRIVLEGVTMSANNTLRYINTFTGEIGPPTGIGFTVLPYILMAAGAGIILVFMMRRRNS